MSLLFLRLLYILFEIIHITFVIVAIPFIIVVAVIESMELISEKFRSKISTEKERKRLNEIHSRN